MGTSKGERAEKRRARKELRAVVRDLRSIRFRLLGVVAALPEGQGDTGTSGYDAATEMRLITQSVLRDNIEPAVLSLREAVRYRAKRGQSA